jgi:histidinol-phosphate aminotransferase
MAFAEPRIINVLNTVKYPYNVNRLTQDYALQMLDKADDVNEWIKTLITERTRLMNMLSNITFVEKIYRSDANFVLVKVADAKAIYAYLTGKGIIVRNRNNISLCENCLRITVGTPSENDTLIKALNAL